ncbi:response regulator transcription factor [Streptomyces sp. JJ36]|nr:response regulator transcription factor [Streptomyces sp. JJ36]
MTRIARNCGSRDLLAMSHQVHGSLLLAQGRTADGLALLDDAMCAVTAGELSSLFTGWIYCLALTHCMAAADLRRAAEWTQAAMRWCASRPTANPFRGLCRVHQVEVLELRGDWPRAEAEAARACAELTPAMEPVAGEAHYVAGEIHRRRGDLAAAEAAYTRAHELGRSPQPGLALLWLAQGRAEPAVAALRLALAGQETGSRSLEGRDEGGPAPGPGAGAPGAAPAASPGPGEETGEGAGDDAAEGAAAEAAAAEAFGGDRLGRSRLLAAQVEVELALGNVPAARTAAAALDTLAATGPPDGGAGLLHATAATARGAVALAALTEAAESAGATGSAGSTGSAAPAGGMGGTTHAGAGAGAHARAGPEAGPALRHLRRALTCWLELRMPYEAAQVRMMLAAADRVAGDTEGARLELQAARTVFARMGAEPDARRAAALLSRGDRGLPGGLSPREAQVLRLVAAGRTNREIAHELTLSEHTVARHLNNIFAKLDVGSRAAATAYAFTHGLTGPDLA